MRERFAYVFVFVCLFELKACALVFRGLNDINLKENTINTNI